MNKYWKFLIDNACERKHTVAHTILSFSKTCPADLVGHILQRAKRIEHLPLYRKSTASIKVFDEYCVKEDIRPAVKRFRQATMRFDQSKGVCNLGGEAVNTLVANKCGFPSHKLLALKYRHLERSSTLIFQRIYGTTGLNHIKKSPAPYNNFPGIFKFLHQSLLKGIFHGDSHLKNIFFDENFENWLFIDFDCAFKLNCPIGAGLALQLATLVQPHDAPFILKEKYKNIVCNYFDQYFPEEDEHKDLFLEFYVTRGHKRGWNRLRLNAASLGNPNNLPAMENQTANNQKISFFDF